ncbi:PREDICTED: profilin-like [Amphimedon queenslandica]|uniref:Profilin n=1 Tax=Amphimedon queenslandica TaxID=400682 RepID=A0A1X7VLQ1_AMPQE|nr:PREDICTED: profilin-like [Amphimedon queenslandica]|eukprot:XP_003383648.1 PREDICTED: profilin-like [Amphimedon queenslandica]
MSWDSYLDNLIGHSKDASGAAHVDKCCIIGLDGGAGWTTAGHANALKGSPTEFANIARAFKSKDFSVFQANGVRVEETKYQFLREEDGKTVYAKKKEHGALTMQASKTAIVIGHCPEGGQQGNTNKAVAVIAEYLESLGM